MRGLRRRIRFLLIAALLAWTGDCVASYPTYRPSIRPLGWTPRGELLFIHQEETGGYDYRDYACGGSGVYALRGGEPRPLVTGHAWCGASRGMAHSTATLSREARRLFVAQEYPADDCGQVRELDVQRRRWSELYRTCDRTFWELAVSPDGRAFVARPGCGLGITPRGCAPSSDGRLRLFAADGTGERPLAGEDYHNPVWSPDGRSLLVSDWNRREIVRLDLATGVERVVARGSAPAWSPDGRWVAYLSDEQDRGRPAVVLRVARADGTRARTVFRHRYGQMWNLETRANGVPLSLLWSPDGRSIVFVRHHNRGETLWRVDTDGDGLRRLTRPIDAAE